MDGKPAVILGGAEELELDDVDEDISAVSVADDADC